MSRYPTWNSILLHGSKDSCIYAYASFVFVKPLSSGMQIKIRVRVYEFNGIMIYISWWIGEEGGGKVIDPRMIGSFPGELLRTANN